MAMKQELRVFIFKILPKSLMSRLFGYLARVPLPGWLLNALIAWYSKKFGVLTDEMRRPALGFRTFNEFFTRKLKDGARVIDAGKGSVV
jgi:phosphatidylserine decarboxylase